MSLSCCCPSMAIRWVALYIFVLHLRFLVCEDTFHFLSPIENDIQAMNRAISLANLGIGKTRPNPCVGCVVLDKDGVLIGEGWHRKAGESHAEVVALKQAGHRSRGGTAYVSLEPCHHFGRTPPCTLALLKYGVSRVVVGMVDPDSRVAGEGLAFLRRQGVKVDVGVENTKCRSLKRSYIYRILNNKPLTVVDDGTLLKGVSKIGKEPMFRIGDPHEESINDMAVLQPDTDTVLMSDRQFLEFFHDSENISHCYELFSNLFPEYITIVVSSLGVVKSTPCSIEYHVNAPICEGGGDLRKIAEVTQRVTSARRWVIMTKHPINSQESESSHVVIHDYRMQADTLKDAERNDRQSVRSVRYRKSLMTLFSEQLGSNSLLMLDVHSVSSDSGQDIY